MPPTNPEYCFLWINHWSTCMQKGEWSGWVQAFGSILAIAMTGVAVWWTYKLQMRAAGEAARDSARATALAQMETICSLADYAVDRVELLPRKGGGVEEGATRTVQFPVTDMQALAAVLREFTPAHVPTGRTLVVILGLIKCADDALEVRDFVARVVPLGNGIPPGMWETVEEMAQGVRDLVQAQRAVLRLQRDEYVLHQS